MLSPSSNSLTTNQPPTPPNAVAVQPLPPPPPFIQMFMAVFMQLFHQVSQQQNQTTINWSTVQEIVHEMARQHRAQRDPRPKCKYYDYCREIACANVQQDYLHPEKPTFPGKVFQQSFHVTHTITESIITICCNADPYFQDKPDALYRLSHGPHVEVLLCLKMLAFGVPGCAYFDYFCVAPATCTECFKRFTAVVARTIMSCQDKYIEEIVSSWWFYDVPMNDSINTPQGGLASQWCKPTWTATNGNPWGKLVLSTSQGSTRQVAAIVRKRKQLAVDKNYRERIILSVWRVFHCSNCNQYFIVVITINNYN